MKQLILSATLCLTAFASGAHLQKTDDTAKAKEKPIRLGNFSISLNVKDLKASKEFYEKLGFKAFVGSEESRMYILQNDSSTIGIFHGEFEKNMLTYNPGWDRNAATLPEFDDVRDIQKRLTALGLKFTLAADESSTGPAALLLEDPDGNPILIDQHVAKPTP